MVFDIATYMCIFIFMYGCIMDVYVYGCKNASQLNIQCWAICIMNPHADRIKLDWYSDFIIL